MKKLIWMEDHSAELVCDAPTCDYVAPKGAFSFGPHLIGTPCPKCGENLLTEIDYKNHMKIMKVVDWINWFGNLFGIGYRSLEEAKAAGVLQIRSVNGEWRTPDNDPDAWKYRK